MPSPLAALVAGRQRQPLGLLLRVAHALGGPRRNQCRQPARRASLIGLAGLADRLPVAPLEEEAHGILEHRSGALALAARPVFTHPLRQAKRQRNDAQANIQGDNQDNQRDDEQVEGDFCAPRRHDQQHIAVADPGAEGNGDRQPEQGDDPEQALHFLLLLLRRPPSAAWVSLSSGSATTTSRASS